MQFSERKKWVWCIRDANEFNTRPKIQLQKCENSDQSFISARLTFLTFNFTRSSFPAFMLYLIPFTLSSLPDFTFFSLIFHCLHFLHRQFIFLSLTSHFFLLAFHLLYFPHRQFIFLSFTSHFIFLLFISFTSCVYLFFPSLYCDSY